MRLPILMALWFASATAAYADGPCNATIFTTRGEIPLKLEIAATPEARAHGLMERTSLTDSDGMVFLFPAPYDYAFYMKNTPLALDMLFINAQNEIVSITENAEPYSLTTHASGQDVVRVIELDGGRASREGIAIGDHVDVMLPPSLTIN
jgi:uncharacterized membrane protein (UPF0127 family)